MIRCDANVSYLLTFTNLYERNKHFLINEKAIENWTNIGTIDEITGHQITGQQTSLERSAS